MSPLPLRVLENAILVPSGRELRVASSMGTVGSSRDEMIEAINAARAAGWSGHHVLGLIAGGEFVVGVYRYDYADGSPTSRVRCCESTTAAR